MSCTGVSWLHRPGTELRRPANYGLRLPARRAGELPVAFVMALRVDVRDYIFDSDLLGNDKTTNNLEFTGGLTFFF